MQELSSKGSKFTDTDRLAFIAVLVEAINVLAARKQTALIEQFSEMAMNLTKAEASWLSNNSVMLDALLNRAHEVCLSMSEEAEPSLYIPLSDRQEKIVADVVKLFTNK